MGPRSAFRETRRLEAAGDPGAGHRRGGANLVGEGDFEGMALGTLAQGFPGPSTRPLPRVARLGRKILRSGEPNIEPEKPNLEPRIMNAPAAAHSPILAS